jgi:hypothetical protein
LKVVNSMVVVLPEGFKGDNLMFTSCEGNNCFIIQKLFQDDYNLNVFFSEDNKIIFGIQKTTRYDYNLTIMESPKPATDNRFKK